MLAMCVSNDHQDCVVTLPYVTFAYNSLRPDTARNSPFFVLFGREPTLPFYTMLPNYAELTTEYAGKAIAHADLARRIARTSFSASEHRRHFGMLSVNAQHTKLRNLEFSCGLLVALKSLRISCPASRVLIPSSEWLPQSRSKLFL